MKQLLIWANFFPQSFKHTQYSKKLANSRAGFTLEQIICRTCWIFATGGFYDRYLLEKGLDRVNSLLRQLNTLNKLYRFLSHLQLIYDFCPFPLICFQLINLHKYKCIYKSECIISLVALGIIDTVRWSSTCELVKGRECYSGQPVLIVLFFAK